jgi:hypothetical protein
MDASGYWVTSLRGSAGKHLAHRKLASGRRPWRIGLQQVTGSPGFVGFGSRVAGPSSWVQPKKCTPGSPATTHGRSGPIFLSFGLYRRRSSPGLSISRRTSSLHLSISDLSLYLSSLSLSVSRVSLCFSALSISRCLSLSGSVYSGKKT